MRRARVIPGLTAPPETFQSLRRHCWRPVASDRYLTLSGEARTAIAPNETSDLSQDRTHLSAFRRNNAQLAGPVHLALRVHAAKPDFRPGRSTSSALYELGTRWSTRRVLDVADDQFRRHSANRSCVVSNLLLERWHAVPGTLCFSNGIPHRDATGESERDVQADRTQEWHNVFRGCHGGRFRRQRERVLDGGRRRRAKQFYSEPGRPHEFWRRCLGRIR